MQNVGCGIFIYVKRCSKKRIKSSFDFFMERENKPGDTIPIWPKKETGEPPKRIKGRLRKTGQETPRARLEKLGVIKEEE